MGPPSLAGETGDETPLAAEIAGGRAFKKDVADGGRCGDADATGRSCSDEQEVLLWLADMLIDIVRRRKRRAARPSGAQPAAT